MTSPSPAAPLKPGDRVRLPSGREATLHHIYVPGNPAPRGTTFRRAWKVSGFPELTYYEDELTLVEAAPPPPPVEGPGLAQAARALADRAEEAESGVGAMALPDSCEVTVTLGQLRALSAALVAEEARRKSHVEKLQDVRRELACYARNDMGERMTGVESALEDVDALIAELGSAP